MIQRHMNWKRGLLRTWLLISAIWVLIVGYLATDVFLKPVPFGGNYQYVRPIKEMPWNTDWSNSYYETHHAPGRGPFPDSFSTLEDRYIEEWDKHVKAGTMHRISFPDRSTLYLSVELTEADQTYLSRLFWDQRWTRYFEQVWPWLRLALGPPLAALILGSALGWVVRGFRGSPADTRAV